MKKSFLYIIPVLLLFASCEEMVTNVDIPASDPHYVLHSYLSPEDSIVKVTAGKSVSVFGEQTENDTTWINTAQVFINGVELPRVAGTYDFVLSTSVFPIAEGQTYTVVLKNGSETLCSGSCSISSSRNQTLVYEGMDSVQYSGDTYYEYYALYSFTDMAGENNYYRVGAEVTYIDPWSSDTVLWVVYPEVQHFIRDLDLDGERMTGRIMIQYAESLGQVLDLKLSLFTCDEMYYNYHRAILSQNGDDPFSEPVIVPTNIEGGLGCIAGYRKYSIEVL